MVHCCVIGCGSNSSRPNKDKSINFHKFPNACKFPDVYEQWLSKIKRDEFIPTRNTVVCSKHFVHDDYNQTCILKQKFLPNYYTNTLKKLNDNAVPSLNLMHLPAIESQCNNENNDCINVTSEMEIQCEIGEETYKTVLNKTQELSENLRICEIGIQCEMGREILRDLIDLPKEQNNSKLSGKSVGCKRKQPCDEDCDTSEQKRVKCDCENKSSDREGDATSPFDTKVEPFEEIIIKEERIEDNPDYVQEYSGKADRRKRKQPSDKDGDTSEQKRDRCDSETNSSDRDADTTSRLDIKQEPVEEIIIKEERLDDYTTYSQAYENLQSQIKNEMHDEDKFQISDQSS